MDGDLDGAVSCYRSHLQQYPHDADSHINLGVALQRLGRREEALACYESVIRLAPGHADAWYNAALMHHISGDLDRANAHYRGALRVAPSHAEANREFGMLRLAQGDFSKDVWGAFRHRRRCAGFEAAVSSCPAPLWSGQPLQDKTVLVHGEQGLGDEILFASCYPDLIASAKRCVIETEPRLETLFQRSFPGAMVLGRQREAELAARYPGIAYKVPCGDLPLYFRTSPASFAGRGPYLHAHADAVAQWRNLLEGLGSGLSVGISWRGGTTRSGQSVRSIALQQWLPVLRVRGVHFVNLQYGECGEELEMARGTLGANVRHWPDAIADYDETAALVCALDLVITVTTSLAHLCGALGRPVWILANAAPRWCYMASGDRTPWYPSAQIFRQCRAGDWDPVITEVATALAQEVSKENRGGHAP